MCVTVQTVILWAGLALEHVKVLVSTGFTSGYRGTALTASGIFWCLYTNKSSLTRSFDT